MQPIASWTGGIVINVLNGVADSLDKIGIWMNDNQSIVNTCTYAIATFFGAWEIIKLMSFIEQAGGVVTVIKLMTSRIWENIAAKVADKAETAALTLMYAKDFLKSIVTGTAALVKQAAQWVITTGVKVADTAATVASTAATAAATAATWLFNAALAVLTSPITLVVLAIGALIAVIILCVKHWDDIKSAATSCWDKIKSVWETVSNWFNTNIIEPISNFFTGMWDNLKNGAKNAWEGIKNVFSTVASFFKNIFSNAWEGVKKVFSTGGKVFVGIKDGIVNSFKSVVNALIKGINKVVATPFKGLNKILQKIHDISFMGISPFTWLTWRAPIPEIPMLAQGGYAKANNPQLAIVGDNKQEGEIISPESKIYEQTKKAILDAGSNVGKQELEITIYHKYEDGKTIIQKINQAQIDAGRVLVLS